MTVAVWLDEVVSEERLLLPGHAACAGCAPAINVRHVLGALAAAKPESKIVLVIPASCWTIIAGVWPVNAFGVSVHLTPFASAAAEASAIKAALRLRGLGDTNVVVWGGDGSTCDIGFSGVSAAAERNEDIIYVLNDNEAYMNTGVQKSGRDPGGRVDDDHAGGRPASRPEEGHRPDHGRARDPVRRDARRSGRCRCCGTSGRRWRRAAEVEGFRFLHVLGACPPGWRYPTDQSTEIARLAVESRYFPLVECDHGEWRITFRPKHEVPVREFLATQGRFGHLTPEQVEAIQAHVDERWNLLAGLESATERS